jgi:hypothetical protein
MKLAVPLSPLTSVALTVTAKSPIRFGVPEMIPDVPEIPNPSGNPIAEKVIASPSGSDAVIGCEITDPTVLARFPGGFTTGGKFNRCRKPITAPTSSAPIGLL